MNKWPLSSNVTPIGNQSIYSPGLSQCIKIVSTHVYIRLAPLHNDTPGCVLKRDASALLHNANQRLVNLKRVVRFKHASGMYMLKAKTSDAQVYVAKMLQNNNSSNSSCNIWIFRNRNVDLWITSLMTGISWNNIQNFILATIIIHWSKTPGN